MLAETALLLLQCSGAPFPAKQLGTKPQRARAPAVFSLASWAAEAACSGGKSQPAQPDFGIRCVCLCVCLFCLNCTLTRWGALDKLFNLLEQFPHR